MSLLDSVRNVLATSDSGYGHLAGAAIDLLQNNAHGGVDGLLQEFTRSGLGDQVKSWIGTGANLPIGQGDIQRILGSDALREVAQRAGVSPDALAGGLASILPQLVDKLSPTGSLPQGDLLSQALSALRGRT
jgi:uncharacterized protein YidB (DUF937 family)